MKEEIKLGKYRHFKGNLYEVIGLALHSETGEEMVVYRQLYGDGGLWVRLATMWNEFVERDGKTRPIAVLPALRTGQTGQNQIMKRSQKNENQNVRENRFDG